MDVLKGKVMKNRYEGKCHYCKDTVVVGGGNLWSWRGRWYMGHPECCNKRKEERKESNTVRIEYPSVGATYSNDVYGVYQYGVYPSSSVLAGQESRTWLGEFETLEEAKVQFPTAVILEGIGYRKVNMSSTAPDWFDNCNAGEEW